MSAVFSVVSEDVPETRPDGVLVRREPAYGREGVANASFGGSLT